MTKSAKFEIILILLAGIMAYGLQIPFLGFFQDDWNFVFYYSMKGTEGLMELMTIDGRPGGVWVYSLGFSLSNFDPALWQAFAITFRILTAITALFILNRLWPERRNVNLTTAIIFLLYPFFTLQPLSISFAQHYVAYFLLGLSFLCTIAAVERPERYLWYTFPAVILTLAHLFTVEYFVGLELLRGIVIWVFVSRRPSRKAGSQLGKTALIWLPYLIMLAFFVLWRSFILASFDIRNNPLNMFSDSGALISSVFQYLIADLILMLASSWANLIEPSLFIIGPIRNLFIAASCLVGGAAFYVLAKNHFLSEEKYARARVFLAAALIIAAGMTPAYSIGYIMNNKLPPWNSRFSLPALLGLALIVSEMINLVITSPKIRRTFLSILLGLTIAHHNANMFNFKTAWEKQERFYQQLIWRAPSIEPGTALISSEEFLAYMGDYPTSMALNTIYETKPTGNIAHWLFTLSNPKTATAIANDEALQGSKISMEFLGSASDAIYLTFEPENDQCLWVHRPEDSNYKYLPASMRAALSNATLSPILDVQADTKIFEQVVDEDTSHWCYFYEKADLARQYNKWDQVVRYWEEAKGQGFRPRNGFEFIPFIEGFAHTGNWKTAFDLTRMSNKTTKAMYFILCPTWKNLVAETPPSEQQQNYLKETNEYLGCSE